MNGFRAAYASIIHAIDGGFVRAFVANFGVASITIVELTVMSYVCKWLGSVVFIEFRLVLIL